MITSGAIAIITFVFKNRILGITATLAGLLILMRFVPLFTGDTPRNVENTTIKVMTFNIHNRNKDIDGTIADILEQKPDIIALQELNPAFRVPLLDGLEQLYPYHTLRSEVLSKGQGVLSRYPLSNVTRSRDNRILSANVHTPEGIFLIVNVHVPSTYSPFSWSQDWSKQRQFIEDIVAAVKDLQSPAILLGDFNSTYLSSNYSLIRSEFRDSFEDSATGIGFTYPSQAKYGIKLPWPVVRIDHIFYNNFFDSISTRIPKTSGGADHRPVLAELEYNW